MSGIRAAMLDDYDVVDSLMHPKNIECLQGFMRRSGSLAVNRGLRTGSEQVVLRATGTSLPVSPEVGLFHFTCGAESAESVDEYLRSPQHRSPEGFLVVDDIDYPGYELYSGIYDPILSGVQSMRSTKLGGRGVLEAVVPVVPGLLSLLEQVLTRLGVSDPRRSWADYLKGFHALVDTEDGQVKFTWHEDVKDVRGGVSRELLTAVVHCTANQTSCMQMLGFGPFVYASQGACVIFRGHAVHRSVPWKDRRGRFATKAVFFLE